jgi:hypothetical protein
VQKDSASTPWCHPYHRRYTVPAPRRKVKARRFRRASLFRLTSPAR